MFLVEQEGSATVLTLNRPEKRNPLSLELMTGLLQTLDHVEGRVLILAANGKVFSSGHDLRELVDRSESEYHEIFGVCTELMLKLQSIPQPVIAEVQGLATAAGCQLVAACDLAIASEEAWFATPGVKIGLFCSTPMVPLTRAIGRKRAMQMLLTGDPIDARTAVEWGLINQVVPRTELRATTLGLAEKLAGASSYTISTGKRAFYAQVDREERAAYECTKRVMIANALAPDAHEGISAFLTKRS